MARVTHQTFGGLVVRAGNDQMIQDGHDIRSELDPGAETVAIVTGGSSRTGRDAACALATWGWAIVLVYLEHQPRADATVAEILAAEGRTVAVRADLGDDLDVQRLFAESIAAFGGVDAVVHTTAARGDLLYRYAARHLRGRGLIVTACTPEPMAPEVALRLGERSITIGSAPPGGVLAFLETWRRQAIA